MAFAPPLHSIEETINYRCLVWNARTVLRCIHCIAQRIFFDINNTAARVLHKIKYVLSVHVRLGRVELTFPKIAYLLSRSFIGSVLGYETCSVTNRRKDKQ